MISLICIQLMRHPLIKLFHLSSLLQMPNDCRMVDVEFCRNFSCSCKRNSFDDPLSCIVNFQWLPTMHFIFKALVSFARLLEPPLHCMFVSSSWTKRIADVVHCLWCFTTHFGRWEFYHWTTNALWPILNSNKKIAWICFLSNIISIV